MLSPLHRRLGFIYLAVGMASAALPASSLAQTEDYVILVANDLGMHCMNKNHQNMSILPPWNTLQAQIIRRGDDQSWPQVVHEDLSLEYSIPGNTYSAGKTDFWDYVYDLFGVDLPPDVGLTGKTLDDVFDVHENMFVAEGIPITPFTDAEPTVEDPYQQAQVILRNLAGDELSRSYPVIPVSTEVTCVSSGCHSSEFDILYEHDDDGGFDPTATPILCADCHGSPPLTGTDPGTAGWFSKALHEKHSFIDEEIPGIAGCYKCHPGNQTQCLRGTMAADHGMICQDCHGDMEEIKHSIEEGRIPWLDEPSCRECHTATYGEPVGELYRNAKGHGGVLCTGCHNSPHAIFPSAVARDNQVMEDLQGHAGTLSDCTVCHGVMPAGAGPHGFVPTGVLEEELLAGVRSLRVYPTPIQRGASCTIMAASRRPESGKLLVFDVRGRTVRMLRGEAAESGTAVATWDGRDAAGHTVAAGTYFLRWDDGERQASAKVVLVN